mmetsp:Transcript_11752/g.11679  ORF Transcript_11752/g.11679 Transcript_11752/m.11679 type:complete len:139 (+) Transcript_11752:376-792(+)
MIKVYRDLNKGPTHAEEIQPCLFCPWCKNKTLLISSKACLGSCDYKIDSNKLKSCRDCIKTTYLEEIGQCISSVCLSKAPKTCKECKGVLDPVLSKQFCRNCLRQKRLKEVNAEKNQKQTEVTCKFCTMLNSINDKQC